MWTIKVHWTTETNPSGLYTEGILNPSCHPGLFKVIKWTFVLKQYRNSDSFPRPTVLRLWQRTVPHGVLTDLELLDGPCLILGENWGLFWAIDPEKITSNVAVWTPSALSTLERCDPRADPRPTIQSAEQCEFSFSSGLLVAFSLFLFFVTQFFLVLYNQPQYIVPINSFDFNPSWIATVVLRIPVYRSTFAETLLRISTILVQTSLFCKQSQTTSICQSNDLDPLFTFDRV